LAMKVNPPKQAWTTKAEHSRNSKRKKKYLIKNTFFSREKSRCCNASHRLANRCVFVRTRLLILNRECIQTLCSELSTREIKKKDYFFFIPTRERISRTQATVTTTRETIYKGLGSIHCQKHPLHRPKQWHCQ